jgi:OCT family organic cation transporter-like MFS transporter 4/5
LSFDFRFALLFVNQVVSAVDSYSMAFLLLMELTSSSHTSFACGLTLMGYTIGEVLVTIFAYISHDWLVLKWITSIYFGVSLPYLYFVPESPYWLLSRKKFDELEICLRKMARTNKRSEEEWLPMYHQLVDDTRLTETFQKEGRPIKRKLVRYLPRLAISGFIEFVTMLLYTKISYGLGASNDTLSPYWNFIIGALVEAIGYLIAGVLITTPLGRKYSLISFATFTSICVLIIPFIMKPYPLATTIVSQLGKLSVSSTVSVSWIYVPELFPTAMRGLANAIFVFVGSFGSILAPIVDEALGDKYVRITFYVYSGLIIVLALIICTLPETRNHSFDDGEERYDSFLNDEDAQTTL